MKGAERRDGSGMCEEKCEEEEERKGVKRSKRRGEM